MDWFGKKENQDQSKAIEALQANQATIIKSMNTWFPWIQKQVNNLYAEIGKLQQTDAAHNATFQSMKQTDAKLQGIVEALSKVGETALEVQK
jgi:hypothetical protein